MSGEDQTPTRLNVSVVSVPMEMVLIYKRCSGIKRTLKKESMFRCKKCKGQTAPTDSLNSNQVNIDEDTFEAVQTFQYLGEVNVELGGCVDAPSTWLTAA